LFEVTHHVDENIGRRTGLAVGIEEHLDGAAHRKCDGDRVGVVDLATKLRLLVEGSPDEPAGRTLRNPSALGPTELRPV